jgi:acetolactate synthase-1/3 small subunit
VPTASVARFGVRKGFAGASSSSGRGRGRRGAAGSGPKAAASDSATGESAADPVGVYGGPARLKEGLRRQTMLIYVADETGMINRVAGVFARRGYNIESLAVGLNVDKAIFTVVVIASDNDAMKLIKQINKLAKVRKVENVTDKMCVERGLMLIKVRASPAQRPEIVELGKVFRASVVDTSDTTLTFATTGDPGKNRAFQQACLKFGIVQVARTGKLALKREPVFSESRRRRVKLMTAMKEARAAVSGMGGARDDEYDSALANKIVRVVSEMDTNADGAFDVGDTYAAMDGGAGAGGVWDVPLLSPAFGSDALDGNATGSQDDIPKLDPNAKYTPHTISIVVMNKPGVLDVVTGVFARRGYNVQSLGVGPEKTFDVSRISTVVPGTYEDVSKLLKQILKVPYVISADDITKTPYVERELMLIKVVCARATRGELVDMCNIFRCKVADVSEDTVTIEVSGKVSKITAMQSLLEPYGILEVARSGRVALPRDSGVDSKLLAAIEDEGDLEFE